MKKLNIILMALVVMFFAQCKPEPIDDDETRKVRVTCEISLNDGGKSDFTNLMENGKVNWSDGRECIYLAIPGATTTIIELEGYADGNPSKLEFEGEVSDGLITSGTQYEIWYFGHSKQTGSPNYELTEGVITGSIANQSGKLKDLGYHHIAMTIVTAETSGGEVVLNLNGTFKNQIAIALLDLSNTTELYGNAIKGTRYTLAYNATTGKFELNVTEDSNAKIKVQSAAGISYVVLLPNANKETLIKSKKAGKTYAYTFHSGIKANKIYYRTASDGVTSEALTWSEYEETANEINGHEYVDLGLPSGLLWATCNIGANSPEEYGDYFAWGETEIKDEYNEGNSLTYGLSISELQSLGYIDANGNLTSQHDAATVNWGDDWRMPTESEMQELLDNCTWERTVQNDVGGYKVTSKVNSNSIFLPGAGYRNGSSLTFAGVTGNYLSSIPLGDNDFAYQLYFSSGSQRVNGYYRELGQSVRPVSGGNIEEPETPDYNGHAYVDLGLSVKWATCNVGTNYYQPEEYGDYFAWGETTTKETYESDNSSTYGLSISELQSQGYIDGNGNLTPQYDVATVKWGGSWRMPTYKELEELENNCTWEWTIENGVNGYKVTGPNGNYIFLPAAGGRDGSSLYHAGSCGDYWSSTFNDNFYDFCAYGLNFDCYIQSVNNNYRYYGNCIRPVVE